MGIIANNIIITSKQQEQVTKPAPVVRSQPKPQPQPVRQVVRQVATEETIDTSKIDTTQHHILVVNGKQKKLSKRSSYLLDMLEIEEDQ